MNAERPDTAPAPQSLKRRWRQRLRAWRGRLIVLALLAAGVVGWRLMNPPPKPPEPATGEVQRADITQRVLAAGVLQPKLRVDVGAQVSGQIQTLHVQLGQRVKKGELLVTINPDLARNDVAQAEAALTQQDAALQGRRLDLQLLQREVQRLRSLALAEAVARQELERQETELAKAEQDIKGQEAQRRRLQADLDKKRLNLSYTQITAPIDGVVVSLPVQEGQTVISIQVPPVMMTLANLDTMRVRTRVPEADVHLVKVGQKVQFTTLATEGTPFLGKVEVVQPIPERAGNASFYGVLFDVDNRDGKLFADMTVQVDIETAQAKQVLTLPVVALGERQSDGRYEVLLSDTSAKDKAGAASPGSAASAPAANKRLVRVGLQDGINAEVLDGLKQGDKVLLAPGADKAEQLGKD
ncbi:efflux RND transporter periplasmic adaptor subunit [Roseateles sp. BYS180W]|uniref:Efflux RND transporter periplasmic adaptor subunit n=1 Tax=Roseateles rivi TaxID=3299028 RepID=A0ABW7FX82_9BURK